MNLSQEPALSLSKGSRALYFSLLTGLESAAGGFFRQTLNEQLPCLSGDN